MATPTQGLPKKPHLVFPEQASKIQQIPSKSHSNALCKTIIVLGLILVIPLFPSQAPDFITQSFLTEFWEIIHLLFIGIAVSYGLFGRRTAQIDIVDSRIDDSRSYLSGISNLSSIFDDGYENICGLDEKDMMQNYANCVCSQRSCDRFSGKGRCVVHSGTKIRSFVSNDGVENIYDGNGENVDQARYSQYSKGKSLVVVSNGKYFLGGTSDFKPLNLPVRSLRSRDVDKDECELRHRNDSSRKFEAKICDDAKVVKIRGVVPLNLEKKFDEVSDRPSIPWRSRSGRMRNGDEMSNPKQSAHCRPHSVGEFEFEHLKSRSLGDSKFSGSPELPTLKVENMKRKRVFTVPKIAPIDDEASFGGPFSNDASSDANRLGDSESTQCSERSFIDDYRGEESGEGKRASESSDADSQSSSLAKVLSRAKSVRTIKPNRYFINQKASQFDGKLGRTCDHQSEADSSIETPPSDHQSHESDRIFPMPKPKPSLLEFHDEEKQSVTLSEEDRESKMDKSFHEDNTTATIDNDGELEGSEVDRKAGEFIAKFREQIRLQKTSSVEGYSSGW